MKRKIAIVGGGMAGLAAAFDLTRTKALQDQFDVTIYQMGWRLGARRRAGALSTGASLSMGCTSGSVAMRTPSSLSEPPMTNGSRKGQAIAKVEDAFQTQVHTAIGSGDTGKFFRLDWPLIDGPPGSWRSAALALGLH